MAARHELLIKDKLTQGREETGNVTLDGNIQSDGEIQARQGVDAPGNTYKAGDGLAIRSSGGSQINTSLVTGKNYVIPYQEIDKTGTKQLFYMDVAAEAKESRQAVYDT